MPNSIAQLLGVQLPIIQAPMAGAQGAELAIAVSGAGGLGSLPCAMLTSSKRENATKKQQKTPKTVETCDRSHPSAAAS